MARGLLDRWFIFTGGNKADEQAFLSFLENNALLMFPDVVQANYTINYSRTRSTAYAPKVTRRTFMSGTKDVFSGGKDYQKIVTFINAIEIGLNKGNYFVNKKDGINIVHGTIDQLIHTHANNSWERLMNILTKINNKLIETDGNWWSVAYSSNGRMMFKDDLNI